MDTRSAIESGLSEELDRVASLLDEQLADEGEAFELGQEAGRAVIGPLLLRQLLGDDRFDTAAVARLLQVTRQALHKRVRAGSLLAVPGRGTTWYPAWQFDTDNRSIRPAAQAVLTAWSEVHGSFDPETVLAWANSSQPEFPECTPAEWIEENGDEEVVVMAARRAARELAS